MEWSMKFWEPNQISRSNTLDLGPTGKGSSSWME